MAIERYSSRREALGPVLTARLAGASRYLRIAGYFRSSLLEVVGEALESVGEIRVVCNGDLDPFDVKVAKAARDGQEALARTLASSWRWRFPSRGLGGVHPGFVRARRQSWIRRTRQGAGVLRSLRLSVLERQVIGANRRPARRFAPAGFACPVPRSPLYCCNRYCEGRATWRVGQ
jgi:hypothetical protein